MYIRIDLGGCSRTINNTHTHTHTHPMLLLYKYFFLSMWKCVFRSCEGNGLIPNIRIIHELIRCMCLCVYMYSPVVTMTTTTTTTKQIRYPTNITCLSSISNHSFPFNFSFIPLSTSQPTRNVYRRNKE